MPQIIRRELEAVIGVQFDLTMRMLLELFRASCVAAVVNVHRKIHNERGRSSEFETAATFHTSQIMINNLKSKCMVGRQWTGGQENLERLESPDESSELFIFHFRFLSFQLS